MKNVLVVGGGAAGLAAASSLLARDRSLAVTVVEPADTHYYQPAWTLVGAGEFDVNQTKRPMASVMPSGVKWVKDLVATFEPENNRVTLAGGDQLAYDYMVVAPGLKLNWDGIEGLSETLGQNGVTSNYRYDLAPYTWQLVNGLRGGRALFTQPAMPIKCAGAPQKAMYLSCHAWERAGVLKNIEVEFHNVGAVLFGVAHYVPSLMKYVERYGANLKFESKLVKVDGPSQTAWFEGKDADGQVQRVERQFDMLHVVPPQTAPDFIKQSPLANADGWCEVDQATLQHARYSNIFSLGDACSAPNAKTAAAARKQAVVVAENLLAQIAGKPLPTKYDGYGSCPLTVEAGKIVLAEFGYGGKLLPTFPLDSTVPRWLNWVLKKNILPWIYWNAMLKGREWLARPVQN